MRGCLIALVALLMVLVGLSGCEGAPRVYDPDRSSTGSWDEYYDPSTSGGMPAITSFQGYEGGEAEAAERSWLRAIAVAPADELWVIVPPDRRTDVDEDIPQAGCLVTPHDHGFDALPMELTRVEADIAGMFAGVQVKQRFENPYEGKIEAVYVFPLSHDAAVTGFIMTIGDRTIRAVVREREEAEKIYYEARAAGRNASLLTQERPNIFTQRVANIEPGGAIDIDITYFQSIEIADGWCEWVFPMTIGPRFTPPAARGTRLTHPGALRASDNPSARLLSPGQATPQRVAIDVTIHAGVPLGELGSPTHPITVEESSGGAAVSLAGETVVPDRDFVLRYRLGGDQASGSITLADAGPGVDAGYFALTIHPPIGATERSRQPVEVTFILDRSGSMKGEPFEQARRAIDDALSWLKPDDTFQIISFSEDVSQFASAPVSATREATGEARRYLGSLNPDGGTYVIKGIESAFAQRGDRARKRIVVLVSDGLVSNEAEIIGRIHDVADDACVFSFGIGSAPNRYLLDRVARVGGGASTFIGNGEDPVEPMRLFLDRVSAPVMTDVHIDFGSLRTADVTPSRVPDLWLGRPVTIVGRLRDRASAAPRGTIAITGKVNGQARRIEVAVDPTAQATGQAMLPQIWASRRIAQLADEAAYLPPAPRQRDIRKLALDYGLSSAFTAFVAVDARSRTSGEFGTTVEQPLPMPVGMRYETAPRVGGR